MAHTSDGRSGKVVCHRAGERWTVELQLDEDGGGKGHHTVFLGRVFATEFTASRAGEQAVADWEGGRVAARDLMLGELAATYRKLRESHQRMEPPLVPTTRSSWEHAIQAWEGLGWIHAGDAARLREHVQWALAPGAGGMAQRRIRLGETESPA